ncbi:MAG: molecular chaperone DnaK [Euryarchaeota archaeon]|nr:molecular chaperone DnaK [Euryarchaeota archaeon]
MAQRILGIDLGTSNSSAAVLRQGKPITIPSREGASPSGKNFPSVIAFTPGGLLVGLSALRQAAANPQGTATAFKRKMGSPHKYVFQGKEYAPEELSSILLRKIREDAETHLGEKVGKAVITVPAYFNDSQRQATKKAGELAGLEVVRIINEPTAAALAYGLDKKGSHTVLVFDLGGGTLDVTLLEFGAGVFQVRATSGDTQLGGTDMDRALVDHLAGEFQKSGGADIRGDPLAMAKLREAAEQAKIILSTETRTGVNIPFFSRDPQGAPLHLKVPLTREVMEGVLRPIVERCRRPLLQVLADAKMDPAGVESVILVGGPTRMPLVRRFVEGVLGKRPEEGIDPMEAVAQGAAIQGAVLSGETGQVLLLDVTPLSLGIETLGGLMNTIIPRNTTIPTKAGELFTTAISGQKHILIHVLQGEREMVRDNFSLGRFMFEVEPAPAGAHRVGVQFTIDENGILHVLAMDTRTGKRVDHTIQSVVNIEEEKVEKMVRESLEHAMEDMKARQTAETRNELDLMVRATETGLADLEPRLSPSEGETIRASLAEARAALPTDDYTRLKNARERLDKSTQNLARLMMDEIQKKTQGAPPGPK